VKMTEVDWFLNVYEKQAIRREYQILSSLDHPNIIKVYYFKYYTTKDNTTYLCLFMEYTETDLFNEYTALGGIDVQTACDYFLQMVSAVGYLHENGIMHRDLKPENMLLANDSETQTKKILIIDFGTSIIADKSSNFAGTYGYLNKRLIKSEEYDKSIDTISLAMTLYEILTRHQSLFKEPEQYKMKNRDINRIYTHNITEMIKNIMRIFNITKEDKLIKLFIRMTDNNPVTRISVKEILQHAWFKKHLSADTIQKYSDAICTTPEPAPAEPEPE